LCKRVTKLYKPYKVKNLAGTVCFTTKVRYLISLKYIYLYRPPFPMEEVEPMDHVEDMEENTEEKQQNDNIKELFELVERGYVFRKTPVYSSKTKTGYFYFINMNNGDRINKQVEMSERQFDEVKQQLKDKMDELYGFHLLDIPTHQKAEQKMEQKVKGGKTTAKSIVETELGKSYAIFLKNLAKQVNWWTEAMNEIGFFATLTALQLAKVEPSKLYSQIMSFRDDPQEFTAFVKEHFVALLEAKKEAEALLKYREEVAKLALKLETAIEIAKKYKKQRDMLLLLYNTAVSVMCNKCKNKFLVSQAVMTVGGVGNGEFAD